MKDLIFIQACPDDNYYIWQVHVWLESLRKIGKSDKAVNTIFIPSDRNRNPNWDKLIALYPESEFFFYKDTDNLTKFLPLYIPVLRPYILAKYFALHPELKEKAIFYCDSDIVFTENFNIDKYLEDDICYVSDTLSYINADYFDSKIKDVKPDKVELYKERDILVETTRLVGTTREIAQKNNLHSGGAQYLLKNIDHTFWQKVMVDCLVIRKHLQAVNRQFFESEVKGFQSWCADMWAVLWGLWVLNKEVQIVPAMNFAWSSDPISKLDVVGILHNAGIVGKLQGDIPVFHKGDYTNGFDPFKDIQVYKVYNDEKSKQLCNHYYVQQMIEVKNKYNLEY